MTELAFEIVLGVLGAMLSPVYAMLFWLMKKVGCHAADIAVLENENEHHNHQGHPTKQHKSKTESD